MSILPLLPLLVPLSGTAIIWILPDRFKTRLFNRWIYTLALIVDMIVLAVLLLTGYVGYQARLWPQAWGGSGELALSADVLSVTFVLLFVGMWLLIAVSMLTRPMERFESVTILLLIVGGTGTFLASNLFTVALFWAITDVLLLTVGLVRAPEETVAQVTRALVGNVLSTMALLAAVVMLMVDQETTAFANLVMPGPTVTLLVAASLLRLGVYPLPASLKRRWEVLLVSFATGSYLWLRFSALLPASAPEIAWLAPLLGWVLTITGILSLLARDFSMALPYILSNGIVNLVLATILDPTLGSPAALLMSVNLLLCLALLLADTQIRPIKPFDRLARLPLTLALASLVGWPVTLGFAAHWSLFRVCWSTGSRGIVLQGSIAYLMLSVPVWQRIQQIRREVRSSGGLPGWQIKAAFVCAALLGVSLVFFGIVPSTFAPIWHSMAPAVVSAGVGPGGGIAMFVTLLATAAIVPFLGSYALHRLLGWRATPIVVIVSRTVQGFLELDWLYGEAQKLLSRLAHFTEYLAAAVEEVFYLGWSLIWILVIILYLI